jgi:hypothetical protein
VQSMPPIAFTIILCLIPLLSTFQNFAIRLMSGVATR